MNKRQKKKFWKKFKTKKFSNIILEEVRYLITPYKEKYPLIRKNLKKARYEIYQVYIGRDNSYEGYYYYQARNKKLSPLKVKRREISCIYYKPTTVNINNFNSYFEGYLRQCSIDEGTRYVLPWKPDKEDQQ